MKSNINPYKIEGILGLIYLITGILMYKFAGNGITSLALTILFVIYFSYFAFNIKKNKQWNDSPLVTLLSLLQKSIAYILIIFILSNYNGTDIILFVLMALTTLYIILAYVLCRKNNEILNTYIYFITTISLYFIIN
ncbi:MAG: hypothetical protein EOM29_03365 [Bacteroidia bacterium]|jgi:hypothetical protein|nr:hypothetical protein [Bacteroidia bacterium]